MEYTLNFWGSDFISTSGFDVLAKRMEDGKATCKHLEQFLKQKSKIDEDYSKSLSKLNKTFPELMEEGTVKKAWQTLKLEIEKTSQVFSTSSQSLFEASKKVSEFYKEQRNTRKPKEDLVVSCAKEKSLYFKKCQDAKKSYEQKSFESETNQHILAKAKANEHLYPTKEWDKIVTKSTKASQEANKAENIYRDLVTKLGEIRSQWEKDMLSYSELCENQDLERLQFLKEQMWEFTNYKSVNSLKQDESMEKVRLSLEQMNPKNDMQCFVSTSFTGQARPDPIKFETYINQVDQKQI